LGAQVKVVTNLSTKANIAISHNLILILKESINYRVRSKNIPEPDQQEAPASHPPVSHPQPKKRNKFT
jgi:hypothetical protein